MLDSKTAIQRWLRSRPRLPVGFIGIIIGGVVATLVGIYIHEFTHQYIYAQYGCQSSIRLLPGFESSFASTKPNTRCWRSLPTESQQELYSLQMMAETIGYQIVPLYGILGAILGFVIGTVLES